MRIFFLAMLSIFSLSTAPGFAQQYPTIVGEWYDEAFPQDCGTPQAYIIGPKSFTADALSCTFRDVAREGWQVTWNGSCSDGSDDTRTKLVALETNGRLTLSFNGGPSDRGYRRCTAKTSLVAPSELPRVPLVYTTFFGNSDAAQKYWPDVVQMVAKFDPPPLVPLQVSVAEAGDLIFAMVDGAMVCGTGHGCPVRIFRDGKRIGEFSACENLDAHQLSADGARFFGCESSGSGTEISAFFN